MGVHELVAFIQSTYPPPGAMPQDQERDDSQPIRVADQEANLTSVDLQPTQRPPVPDWLQTGRAMELSPDHWLISEDDFLLPNWVSPPTIDALAYYLPFHFYRTGWGIYLSATGVLWVARMLTEPDSPRPPPELVSVARAILVEHEHFHFLAEVACSRAEVASAQPLYRRYFANTRVATLEESLANARALRTALRRQSGPIRREIESWMDSQGPGYRDFRNWRSSAAFSDGCLLATRTMLSGVPGHAGGEPAGFLFTGVGRYSCPIYLAPDIATLGVLKPLPRYRGMQALVHSNDHPPAHFHLQITPGRDYTRLEWPSLKPLKGDAQLSGKQQKKLRDYLLRHRAEIEQRIRAVYSSAA